jgi:glycosyltransferase involved in cell wall biosynthesis
MTATLPRDRAVLRVLSNREWLDGRSADSRTVDADLLPALDGLFSGLKSARLWRYDVALIDCDPRWLLVLCAVKTLLPGVRCRIMCVDPVLTRPRNGNGGLRFAIRRRLLRAVDRFVFYFKRTDELARVYGIPADRIRFVPFKPNTLEALKTLEPTDEGFFLCCGRSNRDLDSLYAAFKDLPYKCVVLAPWGDLTQHGTEAGEAPPPNVQLVGDDGSTESWNSWIARSTGVILPILPGMLSPSGIGTYLVAMRLQKCVIITEGVATWDLLTSRNAVLVPPRDVGALKDAVTRVAEDAGFRQGIAAAGLEYAKSLEGDERLRGDLMRELSELVD